jgi:prolipoprotein diacylglyceryltransferase
MVIEGIIIVLCFFLFLFTLFTLSREDFVFMRKNISTEEVFDVAFLTCFAALFVSRALYVVFNFDSAFLNPLVFFLIPYFPGLSLLGAVIGAVLAMAVLTKQRKYPRGRFLDFFSFSFLATLPIGYTGFVFTQDSSLIVFAILPIFYYLFLLLFFLKILLPRFLEGQMRDGMLGLLMLMNYSLFSFILLFVRGIQEKMLSPTPEIIILLLVFFISFFLYIRQGAQITFKRSR